MPSLEYLSKPNSVAFSIFLSRKTISKSGLCQSETRSNQDGYWPALPAGATAPPASLGRSHSTIDEWCQHLVLPLLFP